MGFFIGAVCICPIRGCAFKGSHACIGKNVDKYEPCMPKVKDIDHTCIQPENDCVNMAYCTGSHLTPSKVLNNPKRKGITGLDCDFNRSCVNYARGLPACKKILRNGRGWTMPCYRACSGVTCVDEAKQCAYFNACEQTSARKEQFVFESYFGNKNTTATGVPCAPWWDMFNYPGKLYRVGNHTICRHPRLQIPGAFDSNFEPVFEWDTEKGAPWCFTGRTNDGVPKWDYCFPNCTSTEALETPCVKNDECAMRGKACAHHSSYTGAVSKTVLGYECENWSILNYRTVESLATGFLIGRVDKKHYPPAPGNECRNPTGDPNGPFCLYKKEKEGAVLWDYCFRDCAEAPCVDWTADPPCANYGSDSCYNANAIKDEKATAADGSPCHPWKDHYSLDGIKFGDTNLKENLCAITPFLINKKGRLFGRRGIWKTFARNATKYFIPEGPWCFTEHETVSECFPRCKITGTDYTSVFNGFLVLQETKESKDAALKVEFGEIDPRVGIKTPNAGRREHAVPCEHRALLGKPQCGQEEAALLKCATDMPSICMPTLLTQLSSGVSLACDFYWGSNVGLRDCVRKELFPLSAAFVSSDVAVCCLAPNSNAESEKLKKCTSACMELFRKLDLTQNSLFFSLEGVCQASARTTNDEEMKRKVDAIYECLDQKWSSLDQIE